MKSKGIEILSIFFVVVVLLFVPETTIAGSSSTLSYQSMQHTYAIITFLSTGEDTGSQRKQGQQEQPTAPLQENPTERPEAAADKTLVGTERQNQHLTDIQFPAQASD